MTEIERLQAELEDVNYALDNMSQTDEGYLAATSQYRKLCKRIAEIQQCECSRRLNHDIT